MAFPMRLAPRSGRTLASFEYLHQHISLLEPPHPPSRAERWTIGEFVSGLSTECHIFGDTLSRLIDSAGNLHEQDWSNTELLVEKRCGSHYGEYLASLEQLAQYLAEIVQLTGLGQDGGFMERWSQISRGQYATHAIDNAEPSRVTITYARWKGLIQALAGPSTQLARVAAENQNLVDIAEQSQQEPRNAVWRAVSTARDYFREVAEIIGPHEGFSCGCRDTHEAFVRMRAGDRVLQDASEPTSTISLYFHNKQQTELAAWKWVTANSKLATKAATLSPRRSSSQGRAEPKQPKSSLKQPSKPRSKETSSLRAMLKLPSSLLRNKAQPASNGVENMPDVAAEELKGSPDNNNLCAYFNDSQTGLTDPPAAPSQNIFWLPHSQDPGRGLELELTRSETQRSTEWPAPFSLSAFLSGSGNATLSPENKLRLAHTVAWNLFFLQSTPWLTTSWTSDDIKLINGDDGSVSIEPLLRRRQATQDEMAEDLTVVGLGRFLIELCYGAPWKEIRRAFLSAKESLEEGSDDLIITRIMVWVGQSGVSASDQPFYREGSSYINAVRNCFTQDFGQRLRSNSLEDEEFRLGVYSKIVRPLQFALEGFQARQKEIFGPPVQPTRTTSSTEADVDGVGPMLFDDDECSDARKARFADEWMRDYARVQRIAQSIRPRRPDAPGDRVRVAILDTGVDVSHDDLHEAWIQRQIIYENFVPSGRPSDIPRDDHGHGTHVTSILLQMAGDNVDLYIARISPDGKRWAGEQVAKAIEWAVRDKQVHIISMSFGYPNVDRSLEPIRHAILAAHAAHVLVFAAMGNSGPGNPIAFPACMDEVIAVGSTDGNHNQSDFVPSFAPGKRLCAIGEAMAAAWRRDDPPPGRAGAGDSDNYEDEGHSRTVRRIGTSYATPVAAGVAATLMDLVWTARASHAYESDMLRSKRGMLAVIQGHMVRRDEQSPHEPLVPWRLFDDKLHRQAVDVGGAKMSGVLFRILSTLGNVYD